MTSILPFRLASELSIGWLSIGLFDVASDDSGASPKVPSAAFTTDMSAAESTSAQSCRPAQGQQGSENGVSTDVQQCKLAWRSSHSMKPAVGSGQDTPSYSLGCPAGYAQKFVNHSANMFTITVVACNAACNGTHVSTVIEKLLSIACRTAKGVSASAIGRLQIAGSSENSHW